MIRRALGRLIEWLISYEHEVGVRLDEGACMPFRKYGGDAGYDLVCSRDVGLQPGATYDVPCGVRIDPRDRIWFEIKARSSTMKVRGLEVVDAVIDRDYRGELKAVVHNPTGEHKEIRAGDRVVQVIPHRLIPVRFALAAVLSESPRGSSGFGSTGGL